MAQPDDLPTDLPRDPDCIFCKIVAGQIPCHKLYENDHLLAFLDVGPLAPGHSLIIPKGHWETIDQLPDRVAQAIGGLLPRLSRAVIAATGATAWNVLQNNGRRAHQVVDHVHVHLIPKLENAGLGISWPAGNLDKTHAPRLRQAILDALDE